MVDAAQPAARPRRDLLRAAAAGATASLLAAGATVMSVASAARPAQALRPPGALDEAAFLSACVRCGLCVRDCPPGNLRLSTLGTALPQGIAIGTPWFEARDIPCEMCEAIPCVKACPTGALDPALTDIRKARMGTAVLIDQENCLNHLGLRCDVCYRVCPLVDEAITLEKFSNPRSDRHALLLPTVHADACTGCGKCEKACVLDEPAIKVLPGALARSAPAAHYRRGWERPEGRDGQPVPGLQLPTQRLPEQPVPGDLRPLRGGRAPYEGSGAPGAANPSQTPAAAPSRASDR